MTDLEDAIRATLQARERDIERGDLDAGFVPRARPGVARTVLVGLGAAAAVAAAVLAGLGWFGPSDDGELAAQPGTPVASGSGPTTEPTAAPVAPPPAEQPVYGLWLSSPVVSTSGAEIAVIIYSPAGTTPPEAVFGVGAVVDRWDGTAWHELAAAAFCLDFWACVGAIDLPGADLDAGVPDIGLSLGPGRVGPVQYLDTGGLTPGWYRIRQVANEGTVASGVLQVVDDGVVTVPLDLANDEWLQATPGVLESRGGRVALARAGAEAGLEPPGAEVDLERWTGAAWDAVATLAVTGAGMVDRAVDLPELADGVYRLVDRSGDQEAVVVLGVTAAAPPAPAT